MPVELATMDDIGKAVIELEVRLNTRIIELEQENARLKADLLKVCKQPKGMTVKHTPEGLYITCL